MAFGQSSRAHAGEAVARPWRAGGSKTRRRQRISVPRRAKARPWAPARSPACGTCTAWPRWRQTTMAARKRWHPRRLQGSPAVQIDEGPPKESKGLALVAQSWLCARARASSSPEPQHGRARHGGARSQGWRWRDAVHGGVAHRAPSGVHTRREWGSYGLLLAAQRRPRHTRTRKCRQGEMVVLTWRVRGRKAQRGVELKQGAWCYAMHRCNVDIEVRVASLR